MEELVQILAVIVTGCLVGVEFGVVAFTNPLVAALPDGAYRTVRSHGSRMLGTLMPYWYFSAAALLIAVTVLDPVALRFVAVALMGAVMVLTLAVLVPINNRIGAWAADADVSRELARRWDRLHWLRVGLLGAMFVALVVAGAR